MVQLERRDDNGHAGHLVGQHATHAEQRALGAEAKGEDEEEEVPDGAGDLLGEARAAAVVRAGDGRDERARQQHGPQAARPQVAGYGVARPVRSEERCEGEHNAEAEGDAQARAGRRAREQHQASDELRDREARVRVERRRLPELLAVGWHAAACVVDCLFAHRKPQIKRSGVLCLLWSSI